MAYTWLQFKNVVRGHASDARLNDTTAIKVYAEYVKAHLAIWIDRSPPLYLSHMRNWAAERDRLMGFETLLPRDELRAAVGQLLTVDHSRLGVQEAIDVLLDSARNDLIGSSAFIDRYISQGCIDLQNLIEYYRNGQERVFTTVQAITNGQASEIVLPEHCMIQDIYYVKNRLTVEEAPCERQSVHQYDWQNRFDLICGMPRMPTGCCAGQFYAAIHPNGKKAIVYPSLLEGYHISVFYDGLKSDFLDGDTVPFDDGAALALADYLRVRLYLQQVNQDPKIAALHKAEYERQRRLLYAASRDKVRIRYLNDSPVAGYCHCTLCCEGRDGEGGDGGGGTGPLPTCQEVQSVQTRAEMKALPSHPCRELVFILDPEPNVLMSYRYVDGDTTPANDVSVIEPNDGLGRYFEYQLA